MVGRLFLLRRGFIPTRAAAAASILPAPSFISSSVACFVFSHAPSVPSAIASSRFKSTSAFTGALLWRTAAVDAYPADVASVTLRPTYVDPHRVNLWLALTLNGSTSGDAHPRMRAQSSAVIPFCGSWKD